MIVARKKYADRYAAEQFWRIPGGMAGVWTVAVIGSIGTMGGIYYSFVTPWIDVPQGTWMTWVGGISLGMFALGLTVYVFGRRSARKVSQDDALAHLAVFDLTKTDAEDAAK